MVTTSKAQKVKAVKAAPKIHQASKKSKAVKASGGKRTGNAARKAALSAAEIHEARSRAAKKAAKTRAKNRAQAQRAASKALKAERVRTRLNLNWRSQFNKFASLQSNSIVKKLAMPRNANIEKGSREWEQRKRIANDVRMGVFQGVFFGNAYRLADRRGEALGRESMFRQLQAWTGTGTPFDAFNALISPEFRAAVDKAALEYMRTGDFNVFQEALDSAKEDEYEHLGDVVTAGAGGRVA